MGQGLAYLARSETYNPFFGCEVKFPEWYLDVVLVIYTEKHSTYVARFGLDSPVDFKIIAYDWIVDGRQLRHRRNDNKGVRRLSLPGLQELPILTFEEEKAWELLPAN